MFTGIIQNLGLVSKRVKKQGQIRFVFRFKQKEARRIQLGESIAVNGVCLTVAEISDKGFVADVIKDTLEATNLKELTPNCVVNLERSLRQGDSFGGHFVTGHVDACGILRKIEKDKKNITLWISVPESLMSYIVPKGSITINGVSLTVQKVTEAQLSLGIVPHTLRKTNLRFAKVGTRLNVEVDLIARYLQKAGKLLPRKQQNLSITRLIKQGF